MIDGVNGYLTIGDGLVVATTDATDVAVRATGLIGTGTGNEKKKENEGIGTGTTTDTVTAIGIETMRETVVDAGVKMIVTRQKNDSRGDVARRVRTKLLFSPLLGIVHAGVPRELIPEIVIVIDVLGILATPETNSMTRPGTGEIVGDAATSVALALKTTSINPSHPRLHCRTSLVVCVVVSAVRS
jgi:hypothetical protein